MTQFRTRKSDKQVFPVQQKGVIRSNVSPQVMVGKVPVKKKIRKREPLLPEFVDNKVLTEQQLNLLKRRLNDGKLRQEDIFGEDFDKVFLLTPEQTKKGLDFLNDQRRTPTGAERKNNPFGAREENVLDKFDRFEVTEFFDAGNINFVSNVPLFTVFGKDGSSFQYHFSRGKVNIFG